nr:DUF6198 family protein [bacterium]
MSRKEAFKRYMLLVLGVFFIGLGIAFAKRSNLGISPVSSVANVLSLKFDFFTMGTWLMLWNCLIIVAEVLILKRNFKPIQLLQFPISFLLGFFTDIGVWMVSFLPANAYPVRILMVLVGVIVLGFGITLTVISNTVMNVGEAFVDVLAKALHKSFGNIKVIFDISCVALSILLSLMLFDFSIVGTREGTVITACCTGFVVKWFTKHLQAPIERLLKGGA